MLIVTFYFASMLSHSSALEQYFVQRIVSSISYQKTVAVGKIVQFVLDTVQGLLHSPGNCANLPVLGHFAGHLYHATSDI